MSLPFHHKNSKHFSSWSLQLKTSQVSHIFSPLRSYIDLWISRVTFACSFQTFFPKLLYEWFAFETNNSEGPMHFTNPLIISFYFLLHTSYNNFNHLIIKHFHHAFFNFAQLYDTFNWPEFVVIKFTELKLLQSALLHRKNLMQIRMHLVFIFVFCYHVNPSIMRNHSTFLYRAAITADSI